SQLTQEELEHIAYVQKLAEESLYHVKNATAEFSPEVPVVSRLTQEELDHIAYIERLAQESSLETLSLIKRSNPEQTEDNSAVEQQAGFKDKIMRKLSAEVPVTSQLTQEELDHIASVQKLAEESSSGMLALLEPSLPKEPDSKTIKPKAVVKVEVELSPEITMASQLTQEELDHIAHIQRLADEISFGIAAQPERSIPEPGDDRIFMEPQTDRMDLQSHVIASEESKEELSELTSGADQPSSSNLSSLEDDIRYDTASPRASSNEHVGLFVATYSDNESALTYNSQLTHTELQHIAYAQLAESTKSNLQLTLDAAEDKSVTLHVIEEITETTKQQAKEPTATYFAQEELDRKRYEELAEELLLQPDTSLEQTAQKEPSEGKSSDKTSGADEQSHSDSSFLEGDIDHDMAPELKYGYIKVTAAEMMEKSDEQFSEEEGDYKANPKERSLFTNGRLEKPSALQQSGERSDHALASGTSIESTEMESFENLREELGQEKFMLKSATEVNQQAFSFLTSQIPQECQLGLTENKKKEMVAELVNLYHTRGDTLEEKIGETFELGENNEENSDRAALLNQLAKPAEIMVGKVNTTEPSNEFNAPLTSQSLKTIVTTEEDLGDYSKSESTSGADQLSSSDLSSSETDIPSIYKTASLSQDYRKKQDEQLDQLLEQSFVEKSTWRYPIVSSRAATESKEPFDQLTQEELDHIARIQKLAKEPSLGLLATQQFSKQDRGASVTAESSERAPILSTNTERASDSEDSGTTSGADQPSSPNLSSSVEDYLTHDITSPDKISGKENLGLFELKYFEEETVMVPSTEGYQSTQEELDRSAHMRELAEQRSFETATMPKPFASYHTDKSSKKPSVREPINLTEEELSHIAHIQKLAEEFEISSSQVPFTTNATRGYLMQTQLDIIGDRSTAVRPLPELSMATQLTQGELDHLASTQILAVKSTMELRVQESAAEGGLATVSEMQSRVLTTDNAHDEFNDQEESESTSGADRS
ncbi:unnamed protein product, partial [Strongylus vulgaris]